MKAKFKHAVIMSVLVITGFLGYIWATGTYQQLKDGSGIKSIQEKTLRHELLHEYYFKYASTLEEKKISESINYMYRLFPENFGQYLKTEYFKAGKDVVKMIVNMRKTFKLTSEDIINLRQVLIIWAPIYSLAEENYSVWAKELNLSAISEIFAYFGEDKAPEPLIEAYRGILSEGYLKEYTPLSKETVNRVQSIFESKIKPYI